MLLYIRYLQQSWHIGSAQWRQSLSLSLQWYFATPWTVSTRLPVHGILQAWILEQVATPSSRESSWPTNQTCISWGSCLAGGFFPCWATAARLAANGPQPSFGDLPSASPRWLTSGSPVLGLPLTAHSQCLADAGHTGPPQPNRLQGAVWAPELLRQQRAGMPLGAFPSPILLPHPPLLRAPPPAPNTGLRLYFLFSGPEPAAPACHRRHQQRGGGRHGVAAWLTQVRGLHPLKSGSDWESAALEAFRLSFLSLQGVFGKKQVNKVTNQQKAWGPCGQWRQSRPLGWWHRIGQRCNRASWDVSHEVQANRSPSGQHSRGGWRGEASPQPCSPWRLHLCRRTAPHPPSSVEPESPPQSTCQWPPAPVGVMCPWWAHGSHPIQPITLDREGFAGRIQDTGLSPDHRRSAVREITRQGDKSQTVSAGQPFSLWVKARSSPSTSWPHGSRNP